MMIAKKQITIDDLATMVQKGFLEVKHEMGMMKQEMATKDMLKLVVEDIESIRADVRDIKITLGPLVRMVAALDTDMQHLAIRVARLEKMRK